MGSPVSAGPKWRRNARGDSVADSTWAADGGLLRRSQRFATVAVAQQTFALKPYKQETCG
jgi:hypothetical protein